MMSRSACCRRLSRLLALAFLAVPVLAMGLVPQPAAAQNATPAHRSYINPFPNGDRYRILVVGDSLGEGLWSGLYRAFEDDATLDFIQKAKKSTGFVRTDYYDWNAELDKILKEGSYQVAVVMFGANDRQSMKKDGKWLKVGTEEWREAYGERVESFIKKLRAANIATYWVGLPVMRSPADTASAEKLNDVFREKAFINGAKYIDVWDGFVDDSGRFSAYGPDMSGQTKRLRAYDGVHFTMRGYLKLAHFVENELRKDLNLAKEERNIPLAGDQDEQAKVLTRFTPTPAPEKKTPEAPASGGWGTAPSDEAAAEDGEEEEFKESQVGDVSVVRPTATNTPVQAAILEAEPAEASSPEPEVITSELPGGFTAMATISAVTDLSLASSRPRLPLSERPYYRVLIQGEQLEPKSGRADDFAWPPS
jgi:hypothetical protein